MKLSSLSSVTKLFKYGNRLEPTRDWFILLGLTAVLVLASVGWNIFLFTQLENGKSLGASSAPDHTASSTAPITGVQPVFQKRAAQEANYQHAYTFIDPSVAGS